MCCFLRTTREWSYGFTSRYLINGDELKHIAGLILFYAHLFNLLLLTFLDSFVVKLPEKLKVVVINLQIVGLKNIFAHIFLLLLRFRFVFSENKERERG